MEYRNLDWAAVSEDNEPDDGIQYVDIAALSESGDFLPMDCASKVRFIFTSNAYIYEYLLLAKYVEKI